MTIDRFQSIVLRLSNQYFLRYYLHVNYPRYPQMMGIQFHSFEGPRLISELRQLGFREAPTVGLRCWVVERRDK